MAPRGVVFVGPSLWGGFPTYEELCYRPPAGRGDVRAAFEEGFRWIGLIDGVFYQRLSVSWHELREAHSRGATILGASCVGALRACELPRAVIGVGHVYASFRDHLCDGDDEVAISYDAAARQICAHALINVREALRIASREGTLTQAQAEGAVAHLKSLPFHRRTSSCIRDALRRGGGGGAWPRVEHLLLSGDADIKRRDAVELVDLLARLIRGAGGP